MESGGSMADVQRAGEWLPEVEQDQNVVGAIMRASTCCRCRATPAEGRHVADFDTAANRSCGAPCLKRIQTVRKSDSSHLSMAVCDAGQQLAKVAAGVRLQQPPLVHDVPEKRPARRVLCHHRQVLVREEYLHNKDAQRAGRWSQAGYRKDACLQRIIAPTVRCCDQP